MLDAGGPTWEWVWKGVSPFPIAGIRGCHTREIFEIQHAIW